MRPRFSYQAPRVFVYGRLLKRPRLVIDRCRQVKPLLRGRFEGVKKTEKELTFLREGERSGPLGNALLRIAAAQLASFWAFIAQVEP